MPNLVSLTCPSPQILGKTQARVFPISGFLVSPLQTKIVIRTSHIIDMKLEPVTKLGKRNMAMSMMSLSFLQFLANLQPSGSRILDA